MVEIGTTCGPELLVTLDRSSGKPLHRQLSEDLRHAIQTGRLTPDTRMPATRLLAADLGLSRRLVVDVYNQLTAEGFLVSRRGSGTYVAHVDTARQCPPRAADAAPRYDVDFSPGKPDLSSFPRQAWSRALRQGLTSAPSEAFDYAAPWGLADTRQAISSYLRRTRAVLADPEAVVVCSGVTQGLALVAQALRQTKQLPIAIEDPTFSLHRKILRNNNCQPVPVPVDDEGIDVDALSDSRAKAALTTPAHQAATGVVLSPRRRVLLADWAHSGNIIIEDDYDAEFRYDRAPVGAVQGIAPSQVVYLGSISKTLAPGVRIGWIVLPNPLVETVRNLKSLADMGTSATDQLAFTQMLTSGEYDRHLRQMRRRYLRKRNALLRALARYLPHTTVIGAAAGIQLSVHFPAGYPVDELVDNAARMGVKVQSVNYLYADRAAAPAGLIIGYGNHTESQIVEGVRTLARASAACTTLIGATAQ
jgi:GntR family transcriptional regulator/MocR family aminotransferase